MIFNRSPFRWMIRMARRVRMPRLPRLSFKDLASLYAKWREARYFGFVPPPYEDGMQNASRMAFLYDSILKFARRSSGVALEIGCYKGGSTVFLAKACLQKGITEIHAIDLFTGTPSWGQTFDTFETASNRMRDYHLEHNVTLIRSHSLEYNWDKKIDVLHIDADHTYEAVMGDIAKYVPFMNDGGIIIFDDYDISHNGVRKAIHELLLKQEEFEVVGLNYGAPEYGSICLRVRLRTAMIGFFSFFIGYQSLLAGIESALLL